MLRLTRYRGDDVIIDHQTTVRVLDVCRETGRVTLGFSGPKEVNICRGEIYDWERKDG